MGLSVTTFGLAQALANEALDPDDVTVVRREFDRLNAFLRSRGLPAHIEPDEPPDHDSYRGELDSFPYSSLHFLRRAYAYHRRGLSVTRFSGNDVTDDPVLDAEYRSPVMDSQLIHFPDSVGFYVPIDYDRPLVAAHEEEVLGGAVGSSYGLMRELVDVAPALEIHLEGGKLSDETASELADFEAEDEHPLGTERMVWFTLFEAARKSITFGTVIWFG